MQVNIKKMKIRFAKMQGFKWEDLRYFLAVAQAGNLSAAARSLGVNHATVFRRISSLEKNLGVRLFDRFPDGYVLTAAGEEMVNSVSRIDERITSLSFRISGHDHRLTGTLRVSTTDSLGFILLQPHLYQFHQKYPQIRLELITNNEFFNLTRRHADVAIRPTRSPPEGLVGRKVCVFPWGVYASES
jgi:DNA-binding transcriptional LysR family regulator